MLTAVAILLVVAVIIFAILHVKTGISERWPAQEWFETLIGPEKGDSAASFFKILVAAVGLVVAVIGIAFFALTAKSDVYGIDKLGTLGDFIGGVVNPLLTFLTFLGLIITIVIQQREVAQAREDARGADESRKASAKAQARQSFEATFFEMLTVHNTIVNSMDIRAPRAKAQTSAPVLRSTPKRDPMTFVVSPTISPPEVVEYRARDCFAVFQSEFREYYKEYEADLSLKEEERISRAYERFWLRHQGDLGHYFRYLYNVVRFIDESPALSEEPDKDRMRYMKLLRAQLSDFELFMLFYNCLSDNGYAFKKYVEKYTLLDNLPVGLEIDFAHRGYFEEAAFDEAAISGPSARGVQVVEVPPPQAVYTRRSY